MIGSILQDGFGVSTEPFLLLFEQLIEILFFQWVRLFFEVILFDFIFVIFDNIFGSNGWGIDNPLAFGLFIIFLFTASGVLWINVRSG